jgi:hypothetical protein
VGCARSPWLALSWSSDAALSCTKTPPWPNVRSCRCVPCAPVPLFHPTRQHTPSKPRSAQLAALLSVSGPLTGHPHTHVRTAAQAAELVSAAAANGQTLSFQQLLFEPGWATALQAEVGKPYWAKLEAVRPYASIYVKCAHAVCCTRGSF